MKKAAKEIRTVMRSAYSKSGRLVKEDEVIDVKAIQLEGDTKVTVSVDKAITKNLGNYESFKVSGFISLPCYLDDDDIDRAFAYANAKLDENISKILKEELGE